MIAAIYARKSTDQNTADEEKSVTWGGGFRYEVEGDAGDVLQVCRMRADLRLQRPHTHRYAG